MKRRRTPQARSRARSIVEDDDLDVALQRLLDKLTSCQPMYTEDDVAEIPFPMESSTTSRSPSRHDEDPSTGEPPANSNNNSDSSNFAGLGGNASSAAADGRKAATANAKGSHVASSATVTSPTTAGSSSNSGNNTSATVSLDGPISPGLFLTAVNLFEPKLISKNKRTALDAVKLIRHGYALVWQDPGFISTGWDLHSSSSMLLLGHTEERRSPSPNNGAVGHPPMSRSPAPVFRPDAENIQKLDGCVQALLVHANRSISLRTTLASNESVLRLLCFICSAARELADASAGHSTSTGRDVEAELAAHDAMWLQCGLGGRVVVHLRECYLIEFLLDAALPPAVCSARYEGLAGTLYDKKQKIISDMVTSRSGFSVMMRMVPLRGLAGVATMSAFAQPKLRARLLDKMCTEGLVERLLEEMTGACDAVGRKATPGSVTPTPRKTVRRKSTKSLSASPSPSPQPAAANAAESTRQQQCTTPIEQLGHCIDIMMLVTTPNLRCASEADELSRNPKTAASAVVRPSVWAGQEKVLQAIATHLLWVVCASDRCLAPLQAHAAECVVQIAGYSGCLYGLVVGAIDNIFDQGPLTVGSGGRTSSSSRSPSRATTTTKSVAPGMHISFDDRRGLLPLILRLLQHSTHTAASAPSIRRWFQWLSSNLLPQAFEAPSLTAGRKSSPNWGKARREAAATASTRATSPRPGKLEAPVLARDLRRDEIAYLSPFFTFTRQLVTEGTWWDGMEPFLAKMALLSYHVVLCRPHRPNLLYGQASACYDVTAPLLQPVSGVLPGSPTTATSTPARGKRSRASPGRDEKESLQLFIPSPSRSPVFYEAFSPNASTPSPSGDEGFDSGKRCRLSSSLNEESGSPTQEDDDDEGRSPPGVLTRSWHLSLRMFLSALSGVGLKDDDNK